MQGVEVSLKDARSDGVNDTLVLKNILSETIEVTDVESGKYITAFVKGERRYREIAPGEFYEIALRPKVCSLDQGKFNDLVTIEMKKGDEVLKGEINIACLCNAVEIETPVVAEKPTVVEIPVVAEKPAVVTTDKA